MRILYSHRIQSRDGQGVHVDELIAAFRQAGHEVLVVGPGFYDQAEFGGESRRVAMLRRLLPRTLGELAEIAYNAPAYRRLRRAIDGFKPDLIYERYNLFHLPGAALARRRNIPFFLEVNAPVADERASHGGLRLRRIARRMERRVWRAADRVIAVTGVLRDRIAAAGVDPARIAVLPNGVAPERFAGLPARPDDGTLVLGFVGFVRDWHGIDRVIDAMAHDTAHAMRLVIVGDGPAIPELRAQSARLGVLDRVKFAGVVPHAQVPAHVAGFDIALQPRVVGYASPLKIFDYMAAGRAIVAPDQPNIREILTDNETALLFDPAAPGDLWAAIARLADDAALRTRLGEAAHAEIAARDYTWRGNAARVVAWAEGARP